MNLELPYEMMIEGRYTREMLDCSKRFMSHLIENGIFPASDENVTIADMYWGGLSRNQDERRKQVIGLSNNMREMANNLDHGGMRETIRTANSSVTG